MPDNQANTIPKPSMDEVESASEGVFTDKNKYKFSCYEVMVHKLCNERCFFCSQDHNSRTTAPRPNDKEIYERILFGAKKGYGMLGFTGGEPLMHPNIQKYIKFGRKAGFNFVRIQTNGVMLGYPGFAERCIESGATLFKFSIHHYKADTHDWLVQLPGAFNKVVYGIEKLRKLGARIGINIVLTKQNYQELPEFLLFFLEKGVTDFVIIFPLYENSMNEQGERVGFRFSNTVPFILKSLHIFDVLGLKRPLILNMPMCQLPGYESAIIQSFNGTAVLNLDGSQTNIDDNKAGGKKRVPICSNCKYNDICYGIDEKYLHHWGEDEFQKEKYPLPIEIDIGDIEMKNYFSEDEMCFMEILKKKNPVTIEDISSLKDSIQICQDCDSLNKIISTAQKLESKGFISKKMVDGKIVYNKIVK